MTPWTETLVGVLIVSALSVMGGLVLLFRGEGLRRVLEILVPFAAGALIGEAVIHSIPEVAESPEGFGVTASVAMTAGIIGFFALEKILHWHHAHFPSEEVIHPVAISNLVGDGLHNFVDGGIIAAGFLASWEVGVATVIAVAIHEIPQELGDFAIMLKSGLSARRALLLNFLSALAAVAGAVLTLLVGSADSAERILVPFSAGAFLYIANADLLPELHKEFETGKSLLQLVALIGGISVMLLLLSFE
jgi:zinc and cadmium transporter